MRRHLTKSELEPVWWMDITDIANSLGVTAQTVYYWGRRHGLPSRGRPDPDESGAPSEDEIRERAAEVRSRWTPAERRQRRVGKPVSRRWTPPVIAMADVLGRR